MSETKDFLMASAMDPYVIPRVETILQFLFQGSASESGPNNCNLVNEWLCRDASIVYPTTVWTLSLDECNSTIITCNLLISSPKFSSCLNGIWSYSTSRKPIRRKKTTIIEGKSKSNTKIWAVRTGNRKEHVLLDKVLYFE